MKRKIIFPPEHNRRAVPASIPVHDGSVGAGADRPLFDFETDAALLPTDALARGIGLQEPDQPATVSTAATTSGGVSYTRLNDRFGFIVALSAPLAAVPLALNRPTLWLAWGALTMIATLIYLYSARHIDPTRPLLFVQFPKRVGFSLLGLSLAVPAYAMIQALPLGSMFEAVSSSLAWPDASIPMVELAAPSSISLMPEASALAALRFSFYVVFAFLALEVSSSMQRATRIGWWVFWGVVAHAAWSLVALNLLGDISLWGPKEAYAGSATGTFINRNSFATFLAMGGCLGLALILSNGNRAYQRKPRQIGLMHPDCLSLFPSVLGLGIIVLALVLTQSRMGLVAGLTGLLVCVVMMTLKNGRIGARSLTGLFGIGFCMIAAALAFFGERLMERVVFLERAFEVRMQAYEYAVELIRQRPLVGYGLDAFRSAFEFVHAPPLDVSAIWDRAHSTYLSHWVELGLVVGSFPIMLCLLFASRLVILLRSRKVDYALTVAALSALCLCAIHSLVDFSLEMPANVILFVTILALGVAPRSARRVNLGENSE